MAFSLSPPRPAGHLTIHAAAIALATVTHILCEVLRCLATDGSAPNALFQASSRNVSKNFPLQVSMDAWVENIWIVISVWTLAWLVHAAATLFQWSALGRLSCNPEVHPPLFFLFWITINMARMSGILHWSRCELLGALLAGWLVVVCSFSSLGLSCRNLELHLHSLHLHQPAHIHWTRYLVQNGVAMFCCWSLLEALLVLGQVLCYRGGLPDPLVSSLVLTLVLLFIITWCVLESFAFPRALSYVFTVYPTLILGLGAMFTASYRAHDMAANTVYCGVLMVLATCLSISRTICGCFLTHEPPVRPPVDLDPTWEGCKTVCQAENHKTKHTN